jgi:hypothetical protein
MTLEKRKKRKKIKKIVAAAQATAAAGNVFVTSSIEGVVDLITLQCVAAILVWWYVAKLASYISLHDGKTKFHAN